ncbi:MAG: 3-deoxy-D-manno-octulosonate 8-phosphate phosphatase, partial [Sphingobacteriales bacterium]
VMTDGKLMILEGGEWLRQMHIKDGFAIKHAITNNYKVCVISGSGSAALEERLIALGIPQVDINLHADNKIETYNRFLSSHKIHISESLYMGDDIPDLECIKAAGLAACPSDAAQEIKQNSHFITQAEGGSACVREVIELILKTQGNWQF